MNIATSIINGNVPVTIIHVNGMIDSASYKEFEARVSELIIGGAHHILLDLTHTSYIGSVGLRIIHGIHNKLRTVHSLSVRKAGVRTGLYKSPHLKLFNPSDNIKSVLAISGYDMYLETFDNLKTAIAAFQSFQN